MTHRNKSKGNKNTQNSPEILWRKGHAFLEGGNFEGAKKIFRRLLEESIASGYSENTSSAYKALAEVSLQEGNLDMAEIMILNSLSVSIYLGNNEGKSSSYLLMGWVYERRGEYEKAEEFFEQSLSIKKEKKESVEFGYAYYALGVIFWKKHEYLKAKENLDRALNIYKKYDEKRYFGEIYNVLASISLNDGNIASSKEFYSEMLSIAKRKRDDAGIAGAYDGLAAVCKREGKIDESISLYERALAAYKRINHKLGISAVLHNMGLVYRDEKKNYEKSMRFFEQALSIERAISDKRASLKSKNAIAYIFYLQKEFTKAEDIFRDNLKISEENNYKDVNAYACFKLGRIFFGLEKYDESFEFLKKSLDIYSEINDGLSVGMVLNDLGLYYSKIGNSDLAVTHFETSLAEFEKKSYSKGVEEATKNLREAKSKIN